MNWIKVFLVHLSYMRIIQGTKEFKTNSPYASYVYNCRNINVQVVNTDICLEFETYMNVYGLHKKADLSMCTA